MGVAVSLQDGALWHHASAVVVGEAGILIQGPAGSGKTSLALALLDDARRDGMFARLVGDDRVSMTASHDRVVLRPHPRLAGLVERRGLGVMAMAHEPACVLRLVVTLVGSAAELAERIPAALPQTRLCGIAVPELRLPALAGARNNSGPVLGFLVTLSTDRTWDMSNLLANLAAMHKVAAR